MFKAKDLGKSLAASLIFVVAVLAVSGIAFSHGGDTKIEYQFEITPENPGDLNKPVLKMGNISATRRDFFNYLNNVGAYQMKSDLVQRRFLLHFWIFEGLSRYYPDDINIVLPSVIKLGPTSPDYNAKIDSWIVDQADFYARLLYTYQQAKARGFDKDPATKAVLKLVGYNIKADFLEYLIYGGDIGDTPDAVRAWAKALTPEQKKDVRKFYVLPNEVKGFERSDRRKKWIAYRRALVDDANIDRNYLKLDSLDVPKDTVVMRVDDVTVTVADFQAIYGPVANDINWNNIKKSRCSNLVLSIVLGKEVDKLGILPQRYKDKIELTRMFYIAADEIVRKYVPIALNRTNPDMDFQFYREAAYYMNLNKLQKVYPNETAKLPEYQKLWVDKEYLTGLKWNVRETYRPEQATYF